MSTITIPNATQFPTLYGLTDDIKDINTVMINRAELRELFAKAWDQFVQISAEYDELVDKDGKPTVVNFLGSIEGYRKQFSTAVSTIV